MNRGEIAINYFRNGFNCAQSVLSSYKDKINIKEDELLKISCGLGAGMGMLQDTCGALSGAYLVIGLKYGKYKKDDNDAKGKTFRLVREFDSEFKKINKTTSCKELLECNLLTEEGIKYYIDNNLKEKICIKYIECLVKLLNILVG